LAPAPTKGSGGLDICFVMDCTGSMKPWIDAAKATIREMISALPEERLKRVAFVAYRDFANGLPEAFNFSEDFETIIGFIKQQRATGGADFPEDVAGGLAAALGLNWFAETRTVVLVADAPCHGTKYAYKHHHDDFPEGDPTGLSMTALMEAFRKSHIDFTFVQLTSETDVMQGHLRAAYERAASDNIRKFELRDLRDIIEEAGGADKLSAEAAGPKVTSMLSAAVTPSVMASVASTKKGVPMHSVAIKSSYASYAGSKVPAASGVPPPSVGTLAPPKPKTLVPPSASAVAAASSHSHHSAAPVPSHHSAAPVPSHHSTAAAPVSSHRPTHTPTVVPAASAAAGSIPRASQAPVTASAAPVASHHSTRR